MNKQEKIQEIANRLKSCRAELEDIRDHTLSSEYKKVKESITSAISFLNRASKQMSDIVPIEGQMSLFDYDGVCPEEEKDEMER